jgi:hypothetical protein
MQGVSCVKRVVTAARASNLLKRVKKGITAPADALTHVDEEHSLSKIRQHVGLAHQSVWSASVPV